MAQALYRKWRPQSFDEVVGQEHITTTLKNQIATNRIGHAYLFVGSRGCGKTTTARILAKEINIAGLADDRQAARIAEAIAEGRSLDLIEIDAASHTGVDDIRDLRDKVAFQPSELRYKVYIIDEVHMLSTSAFNALLKTLEEPPPHVVFILATTDPQKIPATVLSRCQRFNFRRVPVGLIVERLRRLCREEGIEADEHALTLIARHATGSLRDAISLLDQLASSSSMRIGVDDVREALGATDAATVRALLHALVNRQAAAGLDAIQAAVDQGADARQIARQMVDGLRAALQIKLGFINDPAGEWNAAERQELTDHAGQVSSQALLRAIRAFSSAINEMRTNTDAQLCLEMAFLECVTAEDQPPTPTAPPASAGRSDWPSRRTSTSAAPAMTSPSAPPAPPAPDSADLAVTAARPPSARPPPSRERRPTPSPSPSPPPSPSAPVPSPGSAQGESAPSTVTAAASVTPTATATATMTVSVETLRGLWKQLIQDVNNTNKAAAALLRSCHPHAVVGDVLKLQADHDLIRERLDVPKNKASVTAALNKLLNGQYTILVFTGQPPEPEPGDDPLVKAAQRLGGRIRE